LTIVVGAAANSVGTTTTFARMPLSDEPEDEGEFTPPLPPDDRLWRHPSEMGAIRATSTTSHRASHVWLVGLCLIGFVTATFALAAVGLVTNSPTSGETDLAVGPSAGALPAEVLASLHQSVVQITVDGPSRSKVVTGLLLRSDGYVITAADPLRNARSLTVTLSDGRAFNATVVGTDMPDDLAVIDIEVSGLATPKIGDPTTVTEGDTVFVIGRTERDRRSWVASATVRSAGMKLTTSDGSSLHGMIGSTLGAPPPSDSSVLCTATGEVLGMITSRAPATPKSAAIFSPSSTLALPRAITTFAHPMTWTSRVADDLITQGEVHFAWLGILSTDSTPPGALVQSVVPNGPADIAGLRQGDIITSLNDQTVATSSDLLVALRMLSADDSATITIHRGDQRVKVTATLSDRT